MKTVTLRLVEGYGTKSNPYIGGTQFDVKVPEEFEKNIHIRSIRIDEEFDNESGSYEIPVIPYEFINHLIGVLKTQADAAFSDKVQREAYKDGLQQAVWRWYESQGHTGLA